MIIEQKRIFPKVTAELSFELGFEKIGLLVKSLQYGFEVQNFYYRCNGRWRCDAGHYISKHNIASSIFTYANNPDQDEIEYMSSYVDHLGVMLEKTEELALQLHKNKLLMENRMRESVLNDQQREREQEAKQQENYIYLMRHQNGLVKIGKSVNPKARERTLQAEDPRLEMFYVAKKPERYERRLHQMFKEHRVRGEWFSLTDRQVQLVMFFLGCNELENCTT